MEHLHNLYNQVYEHYRNSRFNDAFLSDTWRQTLKNRGNLYSFETMMEMHAPGNPVNKWVDDLTYLIDATVVDPGDAVQARILEHGESDFGSPRKDISYRGKKYSSDFIHQTVHAAKIIHALDERGIVEPIVMEIGGGLGGVAAILRNYYGDKLTLYCVDIPETLVCQEWYLRALFPEVGTSHKGTDAEVDFEKRGINFINAYTVESQDFYFDVAINIDSMQEMDKEVVEIYLKFIERNIASGGVFYFQNQFGHSSSPFEEPSEYSLDEYWTVRRAEIGLQMESAAETEQARFIFYRTKEKENPETRRLVLRSIWNGLISGRIGRSPELIGKLAALPGIHTPESAVPAIATLLAAAGVKLQAGEISPLREDLFLSRDCFVDTFNTEPVLTAGNKSFTQSHTEAVWAAQSELLQLMARAGEEPRPFPAAAVKAQVEDLCRRQLLGLEETARSEYWSAQIGCMLFALGQRETARELILACASNSHNVYWLVRFASLLTRFGLAGDSRDLLVRISKSGTIDFHLLAKCVELEFLNNKGQSGFPLSELKKAAGDDPGKLATLARVSAYVAAFPLAESLCGRTVEAAPGQGAQSMYSIAQVAALRKGDSAAAGFIGRLVELCQPDHDSADSMVAYGGLLLAAGKTAEGLTLISDRLEGHPSNYYLLAKAGMILQAEGQGDLADRCLSQSTSTSLRGSSTRRTRTSKKRRPPSRT